MPQLSVTTDIAIALEGQPADSNRIDVISKTNATRQLEEITIDNATNDDLYTVVINGTSFTFTSDGSATVTEIRDGLKADIDGGSEPVITESVSTDILLIESSSASLSFTITVDADVPSDISLVQLVSQGQEIPFGRILVYDARLGDDFARLPRLATDLTGNLALGVALRDSSKAPNANGYADESIIPIMRSGRAYMIAEDAVLAGGAVFVRHVAGAGESLGRVRSDADGSDATALPGARYFSGASAGALVIVEFNLPA